MSKESKKVAPESEAVAEVNPTLSIDGADELIREAEKAQVVREQTERGQQDPNGESEGRLTELEQELETTKDRMLRLQADFDNFRRRAMRERQELQQYGHENFVKDLLPTVDNLERTLDHAKENHGEAFLTGLVEGVELVLRELLSAMGKHGVTPVEADGESFDPSLHEAMSQVPDDSVPANTVIEVFEKGYELRNRLLRPARVIVSARSAEKRESEENGGLDES